MQEKLEKVTLDDFKLYYEVYGSGENVTLCFHGNSRSAKDFKFLSRPNHKIISVHLFLHQYSTFSQERIESGAVHIHHVEKLLEKILEKESAATFNWIGYSQGGLFTLSLFPLFARQVKSIFLISPDGLNNQSFYSKTPFNKSAVKLFRRWVKRPNELQTIVNSMAKVHILQPKIKEFMEYYTSNPELLKMAYKTWRGFRNIRPSYESIKETLEEFPIDFKIIIGEKDRIITVQSAEKFLKKIDKENALILIPYGHNVFKKEIEKEILKIIDTDKQDVTN